MGPSPSAMSLPYAPTPSEPLDYDTVLKQAPADKTTVVCGSTMHSVY